MVDKQPIKRQTRYCQAIEQILPSLGHATNAKLLSLLQESYPDLSATTVHRASARLASRGIIAIAPSAKDGSIRYDANIIAHDHFQCLSCGNLQDADIKTAIIPILKSSIENCDISGRLIINGTCKECTHHK
jgi:Fur family peroxide stress response transcriptional regulator